jgi:hypothetical protein
MLPELHDPFLASGRGTTTGTVAAAATAARLRSLGMGSGGSGALVTSTSGGGGLGTSPSSGGAGPFSRTNSAEDPMSMLVLRQSSMVALRTPSVRWSDYATRDASGAARGGGADGGAAGGGGGAGEALSPEAAAAVAHEREEDVEHRVTPRTFSGTELTRSRPGSLMRPGGLVRPPIPILRHATSGSSAGSGSRAAAGGDEGETAPFSQPLARLGSGSYYPEEDPWPAAAAPLDVNTLRQLSAQRLAARQLSWTAAGLNIAAGVPGLDRAPGVAVPAAPGGARAGSEQSRGGSASATAAPPAGAEREFPGGVWGGAGLSVPAARQAERQAAPMDRLAQAAGDLRRPRTARPPDAWAAPDRSLYPPPCAPAAPAVPRRVVSVRCLHLGTFRFKGADTVDMVWVTTTSLAARHGLMPREEPKGKGRRVAERSGTADAALASLPDILPTLREAFLQEVSSAAAAAAAAGASGPESGGSGTDADEAASEYTSWLSRELTRRRRFGGAGGGPLVYQRGTAPVMPSPFVMRAPAPR